MLVHVCCSVDSHYFFKKMKELYPNEKITAFFYNPNIHPYSEYYLRLLDVRRSCEMLGIELIEGRYDVENWLNFARGFENELEGGKRCEVCFDVRLLESAKLALKLGEKKLTTTLLTSPKKSIELLAKSGEKIASEFNLEFLAIDIRKFGGTQYQYKIAKEDKLYRQNYCGCMFALSRQRDKNLITELISSINRQILPNSIEEKIELYQRRFEIEKSGLNYKIVKERFLNYRLLQAKVTVENVVIDSYFLAYSTLKNGFCKCKIDEQIGDFYYFNRCEIKAILLKNVNKILNKSYQNVKELNKNPLTIEEEVSLRRQFFGNYDLSVVVILDEISTRSYQFYLKSVVFEDVRENLLTF